MFACLQLVLRWLVQAMHWVFQCMHMDGVWLLGVVVQAVPALTMLVSVQLYRCIAFDILVCANKIHW